ncbi:hypothetical protein K435DRAFT_875419 [Dendrothele bispora CBS 962.96]|uniref:Uncharacterized protein n=1 Tax=Dendrothele bispora (strain CBS 962.96) TaxID=1314807 RepID=A0A4S8KUC2_DENBC|nr:hypothetical protein K435DRAFT_875419 [Dendrothele bispora CBS 962.96]
MSGDKLIAKVIVENASRHTKLLSSLADLEDAPRQLAEISAVISELQGQVEESEAKVEKLAEKTKQERTRADNNEKFGSTFKFWKGKSKSSDGTQKRSFAEAMQDEMRERDKLAGLQRALTSAREQKPDILGRVHEYEDLDAQLDALYGLVFSGPTPGYPQEDALEQQVAAARSVHQRVQADLETETETLELLVRAEKTMREAHSKLKDAIYWATALAMLAGGRSAEVKEASALQNAHALARKAELEYNEAKMKSSQVKFLERSKLAREIPQRREGDNTFHEDLTKLSNELTETQSQFSTERKAAYVRVASQNMMAKQAEQALNEYRKELNAARREIFEEIIAKVNNGEYNLDQDDDEAQGMEDAPPSYDSPHPEPSQLELAKYVQYMSLGGGDISALSGGMAHFQRNMGSIGSSRASASPSLDTTFLQHDPYGDELISPLSPATSVMSASTSMSRSNTIDSGYWRVSNTSSPSSSSRRPLPRPPQDR